MTRDEYELECLGTADADGVLHPVPVTDWFAQQSVLIAMWFAGEIETAEFRRNDEPMSPYRITQKGKDRLRNSLEPKP